MMEESCAINDIEMECANQGDLGYKGQLIKQVNKQAFIPQPVLKTKALRWHMPIIGEVPMSKSTLHFRLMISFSVFHPRL